MSLQCLAVFAFLFCPALLSDSSPGIALRGAAKAPVGQGVFESEQGALRLTWELDAKGDATFELTMNGTGFIAIGFGGSMIGADMIVCWVDESGAAHAVDSYSTNHSAPRPDTELGGTDDVDVIGGGRTQGVTSVQFRRLLVTEDAQFDAKLPAAGVVDVVYAWHDGSPGQFAYHGKSHNHVQIDLSKSDGMPATVFGGEQHGEGARGLIHMQSVGTLITMNNADGAGAAGTAGFPYGSVASFADLGDGRPVVLLSTLERNVINLKADPRCSLSVNYPVALDNGTDPMAAPRATLLGSLKVVPATEHKAARAAYLAKHPESEMWIDWKDFSLYTLEPADIYWVGGFGAAHFIGWIAPRQYLAVKASAVAAWPRTGVSSTSGYVTDAFASSYVV